MRTLSVIFYLLAAVGMGVWLLGYLWIVGMACAFGSVSGNCDTPFPWDLGRGDFSIMFIAPLTVIAILVLLGWACGRGPEQEPPYRPPY